MRHEAQTARRDGYVVLFTTAGVRAATAPLDSLDDARAVYARLVGTAGVSDTWIVPLDDLLDHDPAPPPELSCDPVRYSATPDSGQVVAELGGSGPVVLPTYLARSLAMRLWRACRDADYHYRPVTQGG